MLKTQTTPENLFFSPYSLYMALAMIYEGAAGETRAQMRRVLGFSEPRELHAFLQALTQPSAAAQEAQGDPMTLEVANTLWVSKTLKVSKAFVNATRAHHGATVHSVDFSKWDANSPPLGWPLKASRDTLPTSLMDRIKMIVVSAATFKASWTYGFDPKNTRPQPFFVGDKTLSIPTMHLKKGLAYVEVKGQAQVVVLPYIGGASMVVILPNEGRFQDVQAQLASGDLSSYIPDNPLDFITSVDLELPRFSVRSTLMLLPTLDALGLSLALDRQNADFSGMVDDPLDQNLYLSSATQEAMVSAQETGTKAAALSVVIIRGYGSAAPDRYTKVQVNRPFFVVIRHRAHQVPLFLGQIVSP